MQVIGDTVDVSKLPGYKRLLTEEYWKIDDDEFKGVIEEVLENLKTGKINLVDMVKIFGYFSYFIKKGLIDYDMKTIKILFFNGMNVASLTSKYCEDMNEQLNNIAIIEKDKDMDEILEHFEKLNAQLKEKMLTEKAEEILKCIPMRMETFYERFDKECMNVPIFKYYDPFQLFQRLSCASNEDIVTIKEKMLNRVELYHDEIEPEIKNITQLKQILDDYTSSKDNSIKVVMLRDFAKVLGMIIDKYKTSFLGVKKD